MELENPVRLESPKSPEEKASRYIEVLERTRRSLKFSNASELSNESSCQLLDKALVKLIESRQVELDKEKQPLGVPVIVRTSTPDPAQSCIEEDCLGGGRGSPSTPHRPCVPEDLSFPFRSFYESLDGPQSLPYCRSPSRPTPVICRTTSALLKAIIVVKLIASRET